jgi:isocitrate dehydrogenase (NAD+)
MLLDHINRYDLGHELRMAMLGCVAEGIATSDIGGKLGTREFTREVIERMQGKF